MEKACPFVEGKIVSKAHIYRITQSWHKLFKRTALYHWMLFSILLLSVGFCTVWLNIMSHSTAKFIVIAGVISSYCIFLYYYSLKVTSEFANPKKKMPTCGIFRSVYDVLMRPTIPLCDIEVERMCKYGEIYVSYTGLTPSLEVTSSELAEKILKEYELFAKCDLRDIGLTFSHKTIGSENILFANSAFWRETREYIQPALNEVHIYAPIFNRKTAMLCNIFKDKAKGSSNGVNIFLMRWLKAVVLDIAGESFFGCDFQYLTNENPTIESLTYFLQEVFNPIRVAFPVINRLPLKSNRSLDKCVKDLHHMVKRMVDSIKLNPAFDQKRISNMLERLLDGTQKNAMSYDQLRNNALVMIFASHETTLISLAAVLYYLAKYPKLQEELRAESIDLFPNLETDFSTFDEISSRNEQETIYAKLRKFHTLGNFILESIRMHTIVTKPVPRVVTEDTKLAEFHIPKDTIVNINMQAIHMNPNEWENPKTFDPNRFIKESVANRYAYLAFGGGPRVCSGRNFSLIEQKIIICYLLRYFQLELPTPHYQLPALKKNMFVGAINESYHLKFVPIYKHSRDS